ncbi:MSCRAMM family protein [Clostridium perfringens]|uniref:Cell wall surface protein n=1 Tax=Clostridium perfringens TaxID=1502 RepID=G5DSI5_CLOPF|nr:SpaA isopeptide-forming pilin-related protein [Clostridium perfringens]AEP95026.1 cell wall surface protein [Clostridium perfringens]
MTVKDWTTDQILNDKPIKVGQEFYIESSAKPDLSLKLKINYNYQEVKFYFYKYSRGGLNTKPDLPYQSLIRAELEDKFIEKPYEISIDGNFVPSQDIGKVVLTKKDSQNGNVLKGAVFNLQNQKGEDIKTNLTTDENGQIVLNDLAPGDYQFVEIEAPNGYELDKTPVKFTIVVGQREAIKVEKTNILATTNLKISKIDSNTKNPLNGSEFEIYSQNDTSNPLKFITIGSSGQYEVNTIGESILMANGVDSSFTINRLEYGDYILKEIKAPSGYKLREDIYIHLDKNSSYYKSGSDGERINLSKDENFNLYSINVENEKGIILPETGGNGFIKLYNIAYVLIILTIMLFFIYLKFNYKNYFKYMK